jgi:hypothetical protein
MSRPSLCGDDREDDSRVRAEDPTIASVSEVRELAREYFNRPAPPDAEPPLLKARRRLRAEAAGADRRGLVARWSRAFCYIEIHDPTEGEWHDLSWKEAPSWARWEARKRKDLAKGGSRRAFDLTAWEIREIWEAEHDREQTAKKAAGTSGRRSSKASPAWSVAPAPVPPHPGLTLMPCLG